MILHENSSVDNIQYILQELKIQQIELEMQNEEIKRVNAELEGALIKYIGLYNFAPISFFTLNETCEIIDINETGKNLLSIVFNKKNKLNFNTFIVEKSRISFVAFRNNVFKEKTIQTSELILLKTDGTKIYVHVHGVYIQNEEDKTNQMLLCITDLTSIRKIEDELHNTRMSDKIKTEFFSNISHELRTPLNVIFSSLQLMELYKKNKSLQEQSLNNDKNLTIIKQNCRRLLRLVNNLIDSTKIDSGYYDVYFLNEDIVETIKYITLSVIPYAENKNISVKFISHMNKKIIKCDSYLIERAILNVLSNAVKFTDPGGWIVVNMQEAYNKVIISIEDNGIGIHKDELDVIFIRFKQADKSLARNHEGSGIGLNLAKSIVNMHKGLIYVDSELGKGSKFTIELPDKILKQENMPSDKKNEDRKHSRIERINIEFSDIYF